MQIVRNATLKSPEVRRLLGRSGHPDAALEKTVRGILAGVREGGLAAATDYARKFDGLVGSLKVSPKQLAAAAAKCPDEVRAAIRLAIRNVRDFHKHQLEKSWEITGKNGEKLGQRIRPLRRVGLYVPGGAGSYPSTVIMAAVPAQVAGVPELVVTTPAGKGLDPAVACALQELGIREIYRIGGAQAIGLLAYGGAKAGTTPKASDVKPVDKIVGPANVYAALAKKEVFGVVDIDMIAGPSEILVLADRTSDADWVAADLLSQAEHGSGHEAAVCITDDPQTALWISECVEQQVEWSSKRPLLEKTLANFGRILLVKDWDTGVAIANALAPEHCEVMTANPRKLAERIENAGALFLGPWSSEPIGDYVAGPNHTLPTNGTARFSSPLGVYDYLKRTSIIEYSHAAMKRNGPAAVRLAESEGFVHHADAVKRRLG
jgi:histidinol dehydrogenase